MSTIVHARVMPNRAHDYLYDTNHTVAGRTDHIRNMMKCQTADAIIQPSFDNMFSTLRHHPSTRYALRAHNLPSHLGNDRRTYISTQPDVTGANRFKYFRRPIIPYMPSLGAQVVYARRPMAMTAMAAGAVEESSRPVTPFTKTVGIQTMYRESDAQTDPYTPEYTLHPSCADGANPPEILSLLTLTFGQGLPVTTTELELIERARAKRAWEATLPPVTDQASFEKRLRMMEEMEMREWREREDEIKRLQDARLEVLKQVIEEREVANEVLSEERVKKAWERKMVERDQVLEKLQRKKIKALRRLADRRAHVEPKIERRDIISEYADFGSKVYAPCTRNGVFYDKPGATIQVHLGDGVEGFNALSELERDILPKLLNASLLQPPTLEKKSSHTARKDAQLYAQLELMDQKLKERRAADGQSEFRSPSPPLRFAQKIEKPPVRPPTPPILDPREEDEEMEVAAILLQKLIRGRAAQSLMYQGKQRRLNLISELRIRQSVLPPIGSYRSPGRPSSYPASSSPAQDALDRLAGGDHSQAAVAAAAGDVAAAQGLETGAGLRDAVDRAVRRELEVIFGEEIITAGSETDNMPPPTSTDGLTASISSNLLSQYTSQTLAFLTTELVRLRELHRISALVKLAERTRRMREAEESGRRQAEMERRVIEDEVFRQVMTVHRESVESYLEDVVAGVGDRVAGVKAKQQVREYVSRVNRVMEAVENGLPGADQNTGGTSDETTVADLVASFLIPEVERQTLRNQVKSDQRKYIQAAHTSISAAISDIEAQSKDSIHPSTSSLNVRTGPATARASTIAGPNGADDGGVQGLLQRLQSDDAVDGGKDKSAPLSRQGSRSASRVSRQES